MEKNKKTNLKEKFFYYNKQKKFQLSVLDWSPYFDWHVLLLFLFVVVIYAGVFSYQTYSMILEGVEAGPQEIELKKEIVDYQSINTIMENFESRKQVLNNIR